MQNARTFLRLIAKNDSVISYFVCLSKQSKYVDGVRRVSDVRFGMKFLAPWREPVKGNLLNDNNLMVCFTHAEIFLLSCYSL